MAATEQDHEPLTRTERVRQWSKTKSERKKVTAEDILARGEERRRRREEKAAGRLVRPAGLLVRRILVAVMTVVSLGFVFAERGSGIEHEQQLELLNVQAAQLSGQVTDATEELASAKIDPAEAAKALAQAEEKSARVAELQNQYHFHQVSTEVGPDGVGQVVGAQEYQAIHNGLEELFTEAAQGSSQLDPATQWFLMWDETSPGVWELAPGDAYVWEAPQVWTVLDTHTVRVVWLLRETSTGDLLAWASAHYQAKEGRFDTVVLGTTSQGQARIAPTDSDIAGDSSQHEQLPTPSPSASPSPGEQGGE